MSTVCQEQPGTSPGMRHPVSGSSCHCSACALKERGEWHIDARGPRRPTPPTRNAQLAHLQHVCPRQPPDQHGLPSSNAEGARLELPPARLESRWAGHQQCPPRQHMHRMLPGSTCTCPSALQHVHVCRLATGSTGSNNCCPPPATTHPLLEAEGPSPPHPCTPPPPHPHPHTPR